MNTTGFILAICTFVCKQAGWTSAHVVAIFCSQYANSAQLCTQEYLTVATLTMPVYSVTQQPVSVFVFHS